MSIVNCDETGAAPVIEAVRLAERALLAARSTKTYVPPIGVATFLDRLADLVFGREQQHICTVSDKRINLAGSDIDLTEHVAAAVALLL